MILKGAPHSNLVNFLLDTVQCLIRNCTDKSELRAATRNYWKRRFLKTWKSRKANNLLQQKGSLHAE